MTGIPCSATPRAAADARSARWAFELVMNLETAKALGLTIPHSVPRAATIRRLGGRARCFPDELCRPCSFCGRCRSLECSPVEVGNPMLRAHDGLISTPMTTQKSSFHLLG